jgi:uncharacterized protein YjdB
MRVGLVRSVGIGLVALFTLGIAGCDDNPIDFDASEATQIFTNPTVMTVPAGVTQNLESRTLNDGGQPTWDEITATVDATCGPGTVNVVVAADYEPEIQPPAPFEVTGGTTLGATCIQLSGGGVDATVEVTVVGDSLVVVNAPDTLNLHATVQLSAALLADDGTPVTPFDPATDIVWSSDNTDALTVDENGLVTAVGVGAAIITATWTDFGVTQTGTATITVNSPTLEIVDSSTGEAYSDSLFILTTVDLDANLINPTDPPADFGPFDQTNVIWASSDTTIVTVDADGVAQAVGAGTATITATWTGNATVQATVDIPVEFPVATLTSTDVATADALDVVTITGIGFSPGLHMVLIDGALIDDFYAPTVVNATTATFMMPGGVAADVDVTVGVVGTESNALTVSRTCGASDASCASEPDNDTAAGAPDAGALPVSFAGFVDGADHTDLLEFTLAAETTFDINLDWTGNSGDLDVVFTTTGATDYSEAECGFVTATGAQPETGQCTLAAGTYFLWVESYDGELGFYQLDLVEVP